MTEVPPTRLRSWRRHARAELARLRAEARAIRALRASPRFLDREDADGRFVMLLHDHAIVQALLRRIREATPVRYCHLSPAAAARAAR